MTVASPLQGLFFPYIVINWTMDLDLYVIPQPTEGRAQEDKEGRGHVL